MTSRTIPRLLLIPACCIVFPAAAQQPDSSVMARLSSCDTATVRAAADELLRDPGTLDEPLVLFHAASATSMLGEHEHAAFLFLAARLRTSRQILFEKGERPQLLAAMNMTVGPLVLPALAADPAMARRVVDRTQDWDRATPDPYLRRAAASGGDLKEKLAMIDAAIERLPEQLRYEVKMREAGEQAARKVEAMRAERCGRGAPVAPRNP